MMFGRGWNDQTNEPPCEIPRCHQDHCQPLGSGWWGALTHDEVKEIGEAGIETFWQEQITFVLAWLRPLKAMSWPFMR